MLKTCTKCKIEKPLSEFGTNGKSTTKQRRRCDSCYSRKMEIQRRWIERNPEQHQAVIARHRLSGKPRAGRLKSSYGIELEQYEQMLEEQNHRCKICATDKPGGRWSHLQIDHCHKSGLIRGLLCAQCNRGLGYFGDRADILARAAEYLSSQPRVALKAARSALRG